MPKLENIPATEEADIAKIAELTVKQLERRYPDGCPVLRGVHAKAHGCVKARFRVDDNLPEDLRVGVFASPGRDYDALIRFSNASVSMEPDSERDKAGVLLKHGSRGMAVKLVGVTGVPLAGTDAPLTQDFVMINQPVFAFSNVEDYLALSRVLEHKDDPEPFFKDGIKIDPATKKPDMSDPITAHRLRILQIVKRVQSTSLPGQPPVFQPPPPSPVDNQYFSAAPFLFGEDRVMKFTADPAYRSLGEAPNISDPNYLRTALHKRLTGSGARPIVFHFRVQLRTAKDLEGKIDTDIEDATFEWNPQQYPFVDVATITISPQELETDELCESLTFSPWHGLVEHRPLGGINRLRRPVYDASSHHRRAGGCPMSATS